MNFGVQNRFKMNFGVQNRFKMNFGVQNAFSSKKIIPSNNRRDFFRVVDNKISP